MQFKPLPVEEQKRLRAALMGNVKNDTAILMDRKDTTFAGSADEVTDDEVITAIRQVPTHYARNRTNAEGAFNLTRKEELQELWATKKALHNDLTQAKARVKQIKAEIEEVDDKLGVTIENIDQPNLPFVADGAAEG